MLRAIIRHVMRILRALLAAPGNTLRRLLGGGAPTPPTPEFEDTVDEQVEELREELARTPETPLAALTLGEQVHAYAVGDEAAREFFDLGRIPDHVSLALISMATDGLAKLASANPDQCGRWAMGGRSGIVGLPSPVRERMPAVSEKPRDADGQAPVLPEGEQPSAARLALAA
jgi:hypothetical protein